MPGRRLPTVDIHTLLLQIRSHPSDRAVSRMSGLDRRTVHTYRKWAQEQNLLQGPVLSIEELHARAESRPSPIRCLPKTPPPSNPFARSSSNSGEKTFP